MTASTRRTVVYGITLAIGVGLLIYGIEADAAIAREMALMVIGVATGAAALKRPTEE